MMTSAAMTDNIELPQLPRRSPRIAAAAAAVPVPRDERPHKAVRFADEDNENDDTMMPRLESVHEYDDNNFARSVSAVLLDIILAKAHLCVQHDPDPQELPSQQDLKKLYVRLRPPAAALLRAIDECDLSDITDRVLQLLREILEDDYEQDRYAILWQELKRHENDLWHQDAVVRSLVVLRADIEKFLARKRVRRSNASAILLHDVFGSVHALMREALDTCLAVEFGELDFDERNDDDVDAGGDADLHEDGLLVLLDMDETLGHLRRLGNPLRSSIADELDCVSIPNFGRFHFRPNLAEFLHSLDELGCTVCAYTAGSKGYADIVLNGIETITGFTFDGRFYRHDCAVDENGRHFKSLAGELHLTDLSRVVLVDNRSYNHAEQPCNGIWHVQDVRPVLRERFGLTNGRLLLAKEDPSLDIQDLRPYEDGELAVIDHEDEWEDVAAQLRRSERIAEQRAGQPYPALRRSARLAKKPRRDYKL